MGFVHANQNGQISSRSNNIIDIRNQTKEQNLKESLRSSLKGTNGGTPSFLDLLFWDEEGLKGWEAITYLDDYYLTNHEIDLLKQHSEKIALRIKQTPC